MIEYEANRVVWISAGSLRYDAEHNEWLLPYLFDLREGKYPLSHKETGYTGGSRTGLRTTAPFEKAVLVAAELDRRLERTGQDRSLVEMYYCLDWDIPRIARYFTLTNWDARQKIDNAFSYISSGECPRWLVCEKCGQFSGCRKNKKGRRKPIVYREWCRYRNKETGRTYAQIHQLGVPGLDNQT